jgi:hypothetical protein
MLLNKILVLDKGYVALISSANTTKTILDIKDEFFKVETLSDDDTQAIGDIATMTLAVKCPLFVQLNLSKFGLKVINTKLDSVEAYIPNETEIHASDLETNRVIAQDIHRTTEALLINPLAYQRDGCDKFMSQIMSPVSVYNTLIVHGTLNQWMAFGKQEGLPKPIEAYRDSISDILVAEWKFI